MAPDTEFEDVDGQIFRKTGATRFDLSFGNRKIKKREVVCVASSFTGENPPGRLERVFHPRWRSAMVTQLGSRQHPEKMRSSAFVRFVR